MTQPDPNFDVVHPGGQIMVRSCRGGYLHSVVLGESVMDTDAATLARAVLLTAEVSHLKAVMDVRREIVTAGHTPSAELAGPADLEAALRALRSHRLESADARG